MLYLCSVLRIKQNNNKTTNQNKYNNKNQKENDNKN